MDEIDPNLPIAEIERQQLRDISPLFLTKIILSVIKALIKNGCLSWSDIPGNVRKRGQAIDGLNDKYPDMHA